MLHRTSLLLDQVDALRRGGQWSSALELSAQIFETAWRNRSLSEVLDVVCRTGFLHLAKGDRAAATEQFELVLAIAEINQDDHYIGRSQNGLGVIQQAEGNLVAAEALYLSASEKALSAGDRLTRGDTKLNLGIIANIRGILPEALEHYTAAYEAYSEIPNRGRIAQTLNNIGMLQIDLGNYSEASDALSAALNIAKSRNDLPLQGVILSNQAELLLSTKNFAKAREKCDSAYEMASRLEDKLLKTEVLKFYGTLYRENKQPHLAESHLEQALELSVQLANPLLQAEVSRELALVFRETERNRDALTMLFSAHRLFSDLQANNDTADIHRRLDQLESDFMSLVVKWGESIEAKDEYTSGHCRRVAEYACEIARLAGVPALEMNWFRMGAVLHDVGKTEVPAEILNKPGRLTDEERVIIERHTIAGDEILSAIEFPWDVRHMVRSHHERWDGSGYPDGLRGSEIPYNARILKIADVFDALTTNRSYRKPLSSCEAFKIMEDDAGAFDPDLFEIFRSLAPKLIREKTAAPLETS